jgi:hypothetical protein
MGLADMIFDSFYEHVESCTVCQFDEKEFCEEGRRLFARVEALIHDDSL